MSEDGEPTPVVSTSRALMTAMFSAGAAASAGGSFGVSAASGATGAAVELGIGLYDAYTQRRARSAVAALEQAGAIVGGLHILDERTRADDERLELAAKVIEAAAQTTMQSKITALAHVLVAGIDPEGDVDEATVLALALRDLEAPHVVVLQHMAGTAEGWFLNDLQAELTEVRVFDPAVAVLTRHGLITNRVNQGDGLAFGSPKWFVTDVGRRCLFLLDED